MKFLLFAILTVSTFASAQEAPVPQNTAAEPALATPTETENENGWNLGLSWVQWNEKINLQSGAVSDQDNANFKGLNFHFENKRTHSDGGWAVGAAFGSGLATGGGKSALVTYQKGNQAWTSLGLHAKVFKKMSEQLALGVMVPVIYRQVKWENLPGGLPVDSGNDINLGLLFEIDFKLSKKFSFYQDIGPFSSSGGTLWRLGLAYQL